MNIEYWETEKQEKEPLKNYWLDSELEYKTLKSLTWIKKDIKNAIQIDLEALDLDECKLYIYESADEMPRILYCKQASGKVIDVVNENTLLIPFFGDVYRY